MRQMTGKGRAASSSETTKSPVRMRPSRVVATFLSADRRREEEEEEVCVQQAEAVVVQLPPLPAEVTFCVLRVMKVEEPFREECSEPVVLAGWMLMRTAFVTGETPYELTD